jgi:hypothetical protein
MIKYSDEFYSLNQVIQTIQMVGLWFLEFPNLNNLNLATLANSLRPNTMTSCCVPFSARVSDQGALCNNLHHNDASHWHCVSFPPHHDLLLASQQKWLVT